MTPQDAARYLDSFINFEKTGFGSAEMRNVRLARVHDVLDRLGRPERELRCIHVAGTKGKGSTCAFTAQILAAAGCPAGLYTSPHLWDLRERVRIVGREKLSGGPGPVRGPAWACNAVLPLQKEKAAPREIFPDCISPEELAGVLTELRPVFDRVQQEQPHGPLTFFEVLTVTALYYFRRRKVGAVVLETGMGGRLDATNAVDALVCGVTPVSLEHTRVLGPTVTAIAREKAAILKYSWQRAVIGRQPPEAREEIAARARETGCRICSVGKELAVVPAGDGEEEQELTVRGLNGAYRLKTVLSGRHQRDNAAMAVGLAELFCEAAGIPLRTADVERGIAATVFPCRFEIVGESPVTVLDAAHNPDSARALAETVRQSFPGRPVVLLLGISEDKDRAGICEALAPAVTEVVVTRSGHPRAADLDRPDIRRLFPGKPFAGSADVREGLEKARARAGREAVVLAAGSIFMVAEARKVLV